MAVPPSVPIAAVGRVACGSLLFREAGSLQLTAIVKATFTFAHEAVMRIAEPESFLAKEAHRNNNPTRSIARASDLVPRLPGIDVLLTGHAHAENGSAVYGHVRLAVGREGASIIDKTIHVAGDRAGQHIKPFQTMPLIYEKAFGGPGYRDNPVGVGVLDGDAPPNLFFAHDPQRVACFGPISRAWPARSRLVAQQARAAFEQPPIGEIVQGFDLRYFHAAPADQQAAQLIGDEWVLLEGVHPAISPLHLLLPNARGVARVYGGEEDGRLLSLRLDTVRLDADAQTCTLVWRTAFPVREAQLGAMRLMGAVALPGEPIAWPADAGVMSARPAAQPPPAQPATSSNATIALDDDAIEELEPEPEAPDHGDRFAGTLVIPSKRPAGSTTLPFNDAPGTVPLAKPAAAKRDIEGTLDLSEDFAAIAKAALPFPGRAQSATAAAPPATQRMTPIPGSPWDSGRDATGRPTPEPAPPAPTELPATTLVVSNEPAPPARIEPPPPIVVASPIEPPPRIAIEPPLRIAIEPPPPIVVASPVEPLPPIVVASPVEPPPPPRAAPAEPPIDPWGQALRDAPPVSVAPAVPEAAPRKTAPAGPNVHGNLYKRFKKG